MEFKSPESSRVALSSNAPPPRQFAPAFQISSRDRYREPFSDCPSLVQICGSPCHHRTGLRTRAATFEANRGFWLLSTLFSSMTYLHILSHTVFDSSSQRIVAIQAPPSALELQHRLFAKHHRKPSDQDLMAATEEDAIETILKFETAEEEMRKNILKQRDKTHGIDERSDISPSDTIHPASMGEESLGYKMLVREKLRSSSRELEELEANFRALMDAVVTLEMDLRETE
ncbi:hypothetical protein D6D15_04472 [Aureobasidium pullulans]|uniref:Uncharacterized protein n=1 Tax=Aureobasidium pullulans TaxID=5580 RepID=A0A4S9BCI8_AURPU|nr:hypothetical protein D6D15_04472 [Aureobasidium pullulans]